MMNFVCTYCIRTVTVVIGLFLVGCNESSGEITPLPPLLKKATAGSGWSSACPPKNEKERQMIESSGKLAVSPQVEQRLRDEFPSGSNDELLIAALLAQNFKLGKPCDTDPTIQRASFFQKGTGLLPYSTIATVYWKVDEQRRIVWTKGFVSYSGL
ncbi:MAG: hypothetical protein WAO71_08650 [Gallionella sp.]